MRSYTSSQIMSHSLAPVYGSGVCTEVETTGNERCIQQEMMTALRVHHCFRNKETFFTGCLEVLSIYSLVELDIPVHVFYVLIPF